MILNLEKILYICHLLTACGPGHYKGKIDPTNSYCNPSGGNDACLPCQGETIKTSTGDYSSLCDVDCGGVSKVANAEHTACGKLHG